MLRLWNFQKSLEEIEAMDVRWIAAVEAWNYQQAWKRVTDPQARNISKDELRRYTEIKDLLD